MNGPSRRNWRAGATHWLTYIAPALAMVIYLALGGYQLDLPGLHYDEAKEAGLNAMELVTGQAVTAFRDATLQVGPFRLPLMVQDYIGSLCVLLSTPFLLVGGVTVIALRWLSLLIGAGTLSFVWAIGRRLGGALPASTAAFLLALNPSFVFWNRQGVFVTNLTALCMAASLYLGLRWWEGRRSRDLWLVALLCGLGVYAKLLFVWVIGALLSIAIVATIVTRSRRTAFSTTSERRSSRHWLRWGLAAICFVAPLFPLILFNLRTGGTLASVFGNLGQSYYGVDNSAYLPNLMTRVSQIRTLLRGDHFWYLGGVFANAAGPWIAAGMFVATCGVAVFDRSHRNRWAFLLPVSMIALVVLQSAFTVSDLFITHFALAQPLVPLAAGLLLVPWLPGGLETTGRVQAGQGRAAFLRLAPVLCAAIVWGAGDLRATLQYHGALTATGGHAAHSDAIYDLATYLEDLGYVAPVALDWGMDATLRYMTSGKVHPIELFGYSRLDAPDDGFSARVAPFLDNPDNVYISHDEAETVFRGRVSELSALAASRGLELEEEMRIAERSGRPLFVVYRAVQDAGSNP